MQPIREAAQLVRYDASGPAEVTLVTLEYKQDGERWLAECIESGTPAYAGTLDEAREQVLEAVALQLNELARLGHDKDFLRSHSITATPPTPTIQEE